MIIIYISSRKINLIFSLIFLICKMQAVIIWSLEKFKKIKFFFLTSAPTYISVRCNYSFGKNEKGLYLLTPVAFLDLPSVLYSTAPYPALHEGQWQLPPLCPPTPWEKP